MSDFYGKVTNESDAISKIVGKIPGFSGYVERENRRAADKLLREHVAAQFDALWTRLTNVQKDLASSGEMEHLDALENANTKIRTFIDKSTTATYGYAGFFDAVKVNKEELLKLYEFDLALLGKADEMSAAVDNVEKSKGTDGMPAAVSNVVTLSRDLVATFEKRGEVLTTLDESAPAA
jgi:hypothetical protein